MACFGIPCSTLPKQSKQPASRACVYTHTLLSLAESAGKSICSLFGAVDNVYCLKTTYIIKSPTEDEHTPFCPFSAALTLLNHFRGRVIHPRAERGVEWLLRSEERVSKGAAWCDITIVFVKESGQRHLKPIWAAPVMLYPIIPTG